MRDISHTALVNFFSSMCIKPSLFSPSLSTSRLFSRICSSPSVIIPLSSSSLVPNLREYSVLSIAFCMNLGTNAWRSSITRPESIIFPVGIASRVSPISWSRSMSLRVRVWSAFMLVQSPWTNPPLLITASYISSGVTLISSLPRKTLLTVFKNSALPLRVAIYSMFHTRGTMVSPSPRRFNGVSRLLVESFP